MYLLVPVDRWKVGSLLQGIYCVQVWVMCKCVSADSEIQLKCMNTREDSSNIQHFHTIFKQIHTKAKEKEEFNPPTKVSKNSLVFFELLPFTSSKSEKYRMI